MDERVRIRAAYERFPMSIKGAFVVRGADGLPHQLRIEEARVIECAAGERHPLSIEPMVVDAAPTLDTFVPFEVSTLDLRSGWYRLECDVVIDGDAEVAQPGTPFPVAWPRGTVRRGSVRLGTELGPTRFETLECAADSLRLTYAGDRPSVTLELDDAPHPIVAVEHDEAKGAGRILAYPAMRDARVLRVAARGHDRLEIRLP